MRYCAYTVQYAQRKARLLNTLNPKTTVKDNKKGLDYPSIHGLESNFYELMQYNVH